MIFEFFRFELRQQLRSPLLWVFALMFGLMAFGATTSDVVQVGGGVGNVNRNAPTTIASFYGMFSLISLLVIASFVSGALLRDFEQGTADLFFSSPMRKRDFLVGRFGGAMAGCLLVFVMIAIGLLIAPYMPWVDPARVGAFSLWPHLWSFAVIVLPNLLFISALLALLAVVGRNLLVVYVGVIAFMALNGVAGSVVADLDNEALAMMLDPFGMSAYERTIRYWSLPELNSRLPEIGGYLLINRLIWIGVGLAMVAAAFKLFKTERTGTGRGWLRRKAKAAAVTAVAPGAVAAPPKVRPHFSAATVRSQFLQSLRFDAIGVVKSVPFLILLVISMLSFLSAAGSSESVFGTRTYPTTSLMLDTLQRSFSFMLVIVAMFYAGELVFKERNVKIANVSDAMPVPSWLPLMSKFSTLFVVILVFQAAGGVAAVAWQLSKGYTTLEPLLYLRGLLLGAIPFVLMGGLALVLQVLTDNRFIGYGLLIAVLVIRLSLSMLGFEHNLYNYGSAPEAPYSDMNGYGQFLGARLWFQGYWGLLLAALLLLAAAFWVRGLAPSLRERVRLARGRLRGRTGIALAAIVLAWVATGAWIFWNTNVLNHYLPSDVTKDEQARYEKEYRKYRGLPQPSIVAVENDVDLRPETLSVRTRGRYELVNQHAAPIVDFHITVDPNSTIEQLEFGGAKLIRDDARLGYRIYRLDQPMQPGEHRQLRFIQSYAQRGFANEPGNTQIVANGSFFGSSSFPSFGYSDGRQLGDTNERRKRGLGEAQRTAKLENLGARANHALGADADWIDFKTTVCTAPDQIALSPGYLKREFRRHGRRCFDYAMDRPMMPIYSYVSARWLVRRAEHRGIPVEVYYDPKHAFNVNRMIEGVKKSLDYYQANFTPYQHRQVRIIEFPRYEQFAVSFANTIPFSESIGFVADLRDPEAIDYMFYVTAHEVAHQWWGHQVVGANVQGAAMLTESLSQYSALMVMEKEYGRAKMRRFLKYELDSYLSSRSGEQVEELPLYRVEGQGYIHYRKGSLAFYRLREELGEAAVNRALSRFLQDKGYQTAPYTTSAELIDYLRAQAKPDQQGLITDLFEKITFYDNRVVSAASRRRTDGKYEVTVHLKAAKLYADGKGRETQGTLDDWIEIGVFARGPSGKESDERVLSLQRKRVTQGEFEVTVVVDEAPYEVGFDPYNKLIDRVPADNRKRL